MQACTPLVEGSKGSLQPCTVCDHYYSLYQMGGHLTALGKRHVCKCRAGSQSVVSYMPGNVRLAHSTRYQTCLHAWHMCHSCEIILDMVNHQGILYKLCSVGVGGSVLSILTYLDAWSCFEAAKTAPWPSRELHLFGKFLEPSDE